MTTFYVAQNNTSPIFESVLESPDGTTTTLVGASVVFDVWLKDGTKLVDGEAAVVSDAANGVVEYAFSALETATPGMYLARWTVTYADESIESFPNADYDIVEISGDPSGYSITNADVLRGFSTGAASSDLAGYIAMVDESDACLTAKSISPAIGRTLKILAVRHIAQSAADRGAIKREKAVSGAEREYLDRPGGETGYLYSLRTLDKAGCVLSIVNGNSRVQLRSVGRRSTATAI